MPPERDCDAYLATEFGKRVEMCDLLSVVLQAAMPSSLKPNMFADALLRRVLAMADYTLGAL